MAKNINSLPIMFFDGASRGNPGEAAGAAVIVLPNNETYNVSKYLGFATNNEAEYTGVIVGLNKAKDLGIKKIEVKGDSNLVVNQLNGNWKIKSDRLRKLYQEAISLMNSFEGINISWTPREKNKLADAAANKCLDQASGIKKKETKKRDNDEDKNINKDNNYEPVKSTIARIIKLGKKAKFKDYLKLKSGRDEFTSKRLPTLKKMIPEAIQKQIESEWDGNDTYLAKVYRWYLRGLPPDMAIRKVKTDAEVEEKATGIHPWQGKQVKQSQPCQYAIGDVVRIINQKHSKYNQEGVISSPPKLSNQGEWLLNVQIETISFPLSLKEQDITNLEF